MILLYDISYYCISDKDQKCSGFNYPSMKYVDSMLDIIDDSAYVIIDTSIQQSIKSPNFHIIAMAGSDITYDLYIYNDLEFYAILHSNSIEMYKTFIEGEGKVSYMTSTNISVHSTSKKCSIDFHIKSYDYYDFRGTCIYPLKNDFEINLDKKIHIQDFSLYRGPGYLSGMFEPEKYLKLEEFIYDNITSDQLKEYDYFDLDYYLQPGNFEVPKTWKKTSRFHGLNAKETNIIFNDNFIICNRWGSHEERNNITVRPARYFYLNRFDEDDGSSCYPRLTIEVDKDIYMLEKNYFNLDENEHDEYYEDQCRIIGKGNILFYDPEYLKFIQRFCKIDENVHLLNATSEIPTVYACIGQSSLDECKAEIENTDSLKNYEWLWFRNIATVSFLQGYLNIEKVYLTDKTEISNYFYEFNCDMVLTANADVNIAESSFSIYNDHIAIYKSSLDAENPKAKLTLFQNGECNIYYHESPTKIDFSIAFNHDTKLRMKYISDYVPHSIKLKGECNLLIRDYLLSKTDIFQKPDTIKFVINYNKDYGEVLYSDVPIEHDNLIDFILCNTEEKFKEYFNYSRVYSAYIYIKTFILIFLVITNMITRKHFIFIIILKLHLKFQMMY